MKTLVKTRMTSLKILMSLILHCAAFSALAGTNQPTTGQLNTIAKAFFNCRITAKKTTQDELSKNGMCLIEHLHPTLSVREKTGFAIWVSQQKEVLVQADCDLDPQIQSYHELTSHYVCIRVTSFQGITQNHVLFFKPDKATYKVASLYTPIRWN